MTRLFNSDINIGNRRVRVSPVENFEGVNPSDINICFTTIQKLHSDLTAEEENAITLEDFRKHKVVLIADEAHHMNVKTKAQTERSSRVGKTPSSASSNKMKTKINSGQASSLC